MALDARQHNVVTVIGLPNLAASEKVSRREPCSRLQTYEPFLAVSGRLALSSKCPADVELRIDVDCREKTTLATLSILELYSKAEIRHRVSRLDPYDQKLGVGCMSLRTGTWKTLERSRK